MKFMKPYLLAIAVMLPAALQAQSPAAADIALHVASFHIVRVTSERVEAEVDLSVQASRDARVERIELTNLHANGVPFFARPLDEVIDLRKGQDTLLPPLSIVVYFRDLDSLQPLIQIVEDEQARVLAEINLVVRLKPLEQLFLGKARPLAVVSIDQMVEVQPPGGLLGQASAIALLNAGQIALDGGGIVGRRLNFDDPMWDAQVNAAGISLLHAHSCYTIQQKKFTEPICIDQLAFMAAPQQAFSTAELLAPWRFDPFLGKAVADRGGQVQPNDPVINLELLNAKDNARNPIRPVSYQKTGDAPVVQKIVYPSHSELSLLDRTAPGVIGQLQVPMPGGRGLQFASNSIRAQDHWDDLAIFRMTKTADGTWLAKVVFLSGSVEGGTIRLSRSVDRSAMGSPILTPRGVIGIVQTESGGTLVAQPATSR